MITGVPYKLRNGNIKVRTWGGEWELDANGQINSQAIDAFTTGHCHSFALAVNELTGWPMYAGLRSWDDYDSPHHVFNKSPMGFVDVEGKRHIKNYYEVIPVTKEDIYNFHSYLKPRPTFAMPYARTMINNLKIKGVKV